MDLIKEAKDLVLEWHGDRALYFKSLEISNDLNLNYYSYFPHSALNDGDWNKVEIKSCVIAASILTVMVNESKNKELILESVKSKFPVMIYEIVNWLTVREDLDYSEHVFSLLDAGSISVAVRAIESAILNYQEHEAKGENLTINRLSKYILTPRN